MPRDLFYYCYCHFSNYAIFSDIFGGARCSLEFDSDKSGASREIGGLPAAAAGAAAGRGGGSVRGSRGREEEEEGRGMVEESEEGRCGGRGVVEG